MSRLVALKRAIVAEIGRMPGVGEALPFGKLFEVEDIARVSFRSPAAFVAVLASPDGEALAAGDTRTRVEVVAAIAAKGALGSPQDEEALAFAEALYRVTRWQKWGLNGIWPAQRRRMEYMPVPGAKGIALLAVRWEHAIVLDDADPDPAALDGDWPDDPAITVRGPGDA